MHRVKSIRAHAIDLRMGHAWRLPDARATAEELLSLRDARPAVRQLLRAIGGEDAEHLSPAGEML
jgi:hypothetical protein